MTRLVMSQLLMSHASFTPRFMNRPVADRRDLAASDDARSSKRQI